MPSQASWAPLGGIPGAQVGAGSRAVAGRSLGSRSPGQLLLEALAGVSAPIPVATITTKAHPGHEELAGAGSPIPPQQGPPGQSLMAGTMGHSFSLSPLSHQAPRQSPPCPQHPHSAGHHCREPPCSQAPTHMAWPLSLALSHSICRSQLRAWQHHAGFVWSQHAPAPSSRRRAGGWLSGFAPLAPVGGSLHLPSPGQHRCWHLGPV